MQVGNISAARQKPSKKGSSANRANHLPLQAHRASPLSWALPLSALDMQDDYFPGILLQMLC